MYSALEIAKWFLFKNNAEVQEHEVANDDYEVYERITHLKLQKLLYFAQGISLAIYNKPIFKEKIEAWQHGPVVKEVYSLFSTFGRNPIIMPMQDTDEEIITKIEQDKEVIDILNLTYNNFAIYTAWQLREMTHMNNSPWDITEKTKGLGTEIDRDLINKYFREEIVE